MKAALVGADGALLHEARRATGRERGPDAVVEAILDFAARAARVRRASTSARAPSPPASPCPASSTPSTGIAVYAANLGWRDVPLRDLLARAARRHPRRARPRRPHRRARRGPDRRRQGRRPLPVRAAGHRHRRRHRHRRAGSRPGAHGYAGEIGHIVVRPDGPACGCGQRGCLETLASAAAVSRAWAAASGDPDADAADCAKAVESGDPRGPAGLAGRRRRARRRPGHRAHPAGPPHADHRWRSRRGGGNLVHTAAGGGRGAGHVPEAAPHRPGGPRGHRRMPGRGAARLGSPLRRR